MKRLFLPRRSLVGAALLAGLPGVARAQAFPSRPIQFIVPLGVGSSADIIARLVAQSMSEETGDQVLVENRTGADGVLGTRVAVGAKPDGYTLLLGHSNSNAVAPALYPKLPYDPLRDLSPVGLVAISPLVIVTGADSPYRSLQDVIKAAQAKPGSINYASSGSGTVACGGDGAGSIRHGAAVKATNGRQAHLE